MSFFINDALAAEAAQEQNLLTGMLPLIIIFILFWFLLIRPQTKRAKEHKQLVQALAKGDEVVTNGGVLGKITGVDESFISLEISSGVVVKVQRQAVATIMPKGTIKS
ncbi:MAG: preprotein translocase subunit YajC [Gammaproteobacteria bacterium]|nr:preprotein translocase subunit YajC [Gammaproteobacteria bacterium]